MAEWTHYLGDAETFPILRAWHFFNHAGVSPLPQPVAAAIRQYADQSETAAYINKGWFRNIELLRVAVGSLLNCHRDEVAFVKNTSEGISIVANGLEWQWGDRIVTSAVEYPANIYPWMEVVRSRGVKLIMVEEETQPDGSRAVPVEKILAEAADPRTKLVTLSHVEYASGQRHDLASIGAYCRQNNKLFCVDGIQSVGILPVDVKAMNIDYLSADGHKWMLGPEGAGIFYCRRELLERTRPLMVGWMNVVDAQNYGHYDYTLRPDAGRFECGTYNVPGLLGLKAAIDLLLSAGIENIGQRIKALTDLLIIGLRNKGYQVISPRTNEQWSGIVSFTAATHSHDQLYVTLRRDHHIEIAVRERRLRCSPHFYNTEAQIQRLLEALPAN